MIIATSITKDYLIRSRPFFESVNKYFEGRKIVFCIGFSLDNDAIEGWEVVCIHNSHLKSHITGFPSNRESFYTMQTGEFADWSTFKDDDEVLFIDSDMILQRPFDLNFNFDEAEFFVSDSSFPATPLHQVIQNVKCITSTEMFLSKFSIEEDEVEFTSAFLCAKIKDWKKLYREILKIQDEFLSYFSHHAAWQLIINYAIINFFRYRLISPLIQNADWYSGTEAESRNNRLMWHDKTVYFNHTKFNGNWNY